VGTAIPKREHLAAEKDTLRALLWLVAFVKESSAMAEIRVERKEGGSGIWPWIIGLLIAVAVLWFVFGRDRTPATTGASTPDTAAPAAPSEAPRSSPALAAVAAFSTFTESHGASGDESSQHDYTAGGIRRLADALASIAGSRGSSDPALASELDNMRSKADALESSADNSTMHADMARSAFSSATKVLTLMESRFPGLKSHVAQVAKAAAGLKPGPHLLEQQAAVQAFFDAARGALGEVGPAVS